MTSQLKLHNKTFNFMSILPFSCRSLQNIILLLDLFQDLESERIRLSWAHVVTNLCAIHLPRISKPTVMSYQFLYKIPIRVLSYLCVYSLLSAYFSLLFLLGRVTFLYSYLKSFFLGNIYTFHSLFKLM